MFSVCFVAFIVNGNPEPKIYMLPNCDPKNSGNIDCHIDQLHDTGAKHAVCWDRKTKKMVYTGSAYLEVKA